MSLRKSRWRHNLRLTELQAAKEWSIRPGEWDELDLEERALMVAVVVTERQMETWDAQIAIHKAEHR